MKRYARYGIFYAHDRHEWLVWDTLAQIPIARCRFKREALAIQDEAETEWQERKGA